MKSKWRIRKGIRRGKRVAIVARLVRGHWRTIGYFNNFNFGRGVVASLNGK